MCVHMLIHSSQNYNIIIDKCNQKSVNSKTGFHLAQNSAFHNSERNHQSVATRDEIWHPCDAELQQFLLHAIRSPKGSNKTRAWSLHRWWQRSAERRSSQLALSDTRSLAHLTKSVLVTTKHCSALRVGLSDERATLIRQRSAQVTNDVCQIK